MKVRLRLGKFLSEGDERRFFGALQEIQGLGKPRGGGRELEVEILGSKMRRKDAMELIALLVRYGLSVSPLQELGKLKKFEWLSDPHWYWHHMMFSTRGPSRRRTSGS